MGLRWSAKEQFRVGRISLPKANLIGIINLMTAYQHNAVYARTNQETTIALFPIPARHLLARA